jgi:transposase-like protein
VAESDQWTGQRRAAVVLELLQGRTTPEEASRRYGLAAEELVRWQKRFLEGAEQALDPTNPHSGRAAEVVRDLYAKIGAQAMEIENLKKQLGNTSPSATATG